MAAPPRNDDISIIYLGIAVKHETPGDLQDLQDLALDRLAGLCYTY